MWSYASVVAKRSIYRRKQSQIFILRSSRLDGYLGGYDEDRRDESYRWWSSDGGDKSGKSSGFGDNGSSSSGGGGGRHNRPSRDSGAGGPDDGAGGPDDGAGARGPDAGARGPTRRGFDSASGGRGPPRSGGRMEGVGGSGGGGGNRPPYQSRQDNNWNNQDLSRTHNQSNRLAPQEGGGGGSRGGRRPQPKKISFSKQFLDPAARGELQKGHKSGIPKLAVRRPKGHGIRSAALEGRFGIVDDGLDVLDVEPDEDFVSFEGGKQRQPQAPIPMGSIDQDSPLEELPPEELEAVRQFLEEWHAVRGAPEEDDDHFWKEDEYDTYLNPQERKLLETINAEKDVRYADDNAKLDAGIKNEFYKYCEEIIQEQKAIDPFRSQHVPAAIRDLVEKQKEDEGEKDDDPVFCIVDYIENNKKFEQRGDDVELVTQLETAGRELLLDDILDHPTEFAQARFNFPHPESRREPKPLFPKNRVNPPKEFVEAFSRFMYVWGLPQIMIDGKSADFENPLHRHEVQKAIANIFLVDLDSVFPASLTSGFVGFASSEERMFALEAGPQPTFDSPAWISKYESTDGESQFCRKSPESIVVIENLPVGHTPASLASTLFPSGTDVGEIYGRITVDDVHMISPSAALIRFESAEMASSALTSSMVEQRLVDIGQERKVRYAKARRELVFNGKHGGPDGTERLRAMGPRLIVDGDMPPKQLFLSHANTIQLRYLDPSVTKKQIAEFFQPFCSCPRDVKGSVEFVTCHQGIPTGKAYVGFDELGEMEAVQAAFPGGRVIGLSPNTVIMKAVKDLVPLNREQRPSRSEEGLLDSLNNWEQYVDPADIEYLVQNGISKDALDEALRAMRYKNPTFAAFDQGIRAETLQTEFESGGMYKALVQEYIATLKECVSTPENPGAVFESLFLPGEEFDTTLFDREPKRQEDLRRRRQLP